MYYTIIYIGISILPIVASFIINISIASILYTICLYRYLTSDNLKINALMVSTYTYIYLIYTTKIKYILYKYEFMSVFK